MISKQQQKYVQSLHNKKYRTEYSRFLVEGEKGILEIINSDFEIEYIFCSENLKLKIDSVRKNIKVNICKEEEISTISTFKNNNTGVALVHQKANSHFDLNLKDNVVLILDNIKDPGNLGTIIRLADWYGINNIYCSQDTVEFYNPKVISSTMGSFTRVNVHYIDLSSTLKKLKMPILGAFLGGENIQKYKSESQIALIIGSESHGISPEIEQFVTKKITIPRIGKAESLNAAIATGIILDNIFREV
ncbi:RNA methyltransferase [Lacihabitans sp. LS3-19]|uniref:RNA methyltransferase n=1 Tax=Lacihabitans sp. LS3-19 TaxID=2487335 RepID=UPI0020CDA172|nr:RNA methyltransferase [Lacihabitans sp. LS3-19]MCP9766970.1 RNA methyltransferase [Lacihabitans sp. LS3-19]